MAQTISFDEFEHDLVRIIEQVRARREPVLVERNSATFRLEIDEPEHIWSDYDPEEAKRALRAAQGMFAGTDTESFLAEMAELREQGLRCSVKG